LAPNLAKPSGVVYLLAPPRPWNSKPCCR